MSAAMTGRAHVAAARPDSTTTNLPNAATAVRVANWRNGVTTAARLIVARLIVARLIVARLIAVRLIAVRLIAVRLIAVRLIAVPVSEHSRSAAQAGEAQADGARRNRIAERGVAAKVDVSGRDARNFAANADLQRNVDLVGVSTVDMASASPGLNIGRVISAVTDTLAATASLADTRMNASGAKASGAKALGAKILGATVFHTGAVGTTDSLGLTLGGIASLAGADSAAGATGTQATAITVGLAQPSTADFLTTAFLTAAFPNVAFPTAGLPIAASGTAANLAGRTTGNGDSDTDLAISPISRDTIGAVSGFIDGSRFTAHISQVARTCGAVSVGMSAVSAARCMPAGGELIFSSLRRTRIKTES